MRDASEFHPDLITTEVFAESLLSATPLQSSSQNCDVDIVLNYIGNLMVVFNAKTTSDAKPCHDNAFVSSPAKSFTLPMYLFSLF